jgi:hypothetical protein
MKDMTIEELLDDLSSYSDVSDEYYKLKDEIVAEYMGWSFDDDANLYFYTNKELDLCIAHYDLNDAGLCVQKMVEKGDDGNFFAYALECRPNKDWLVKWLFNAENFFTAMAAWLRSKGKRGEND